MSLMLSNYATVALHFFLLLQFYFSFSNFQQCLVTCFSLMWLQRKNEISPRGISNFSIFRFCVTPSTFCVLNITTHHLLRIMLCKLCVFFFLQLELVHFLTNCWCYPYLHHCCWFLKYALPFNSKIWMKLIVCFENFYTVSIFFLAKNWFYSGLNVTDLNGWLLIVEWILFERYIAYLYDSTCKTKSVSLPV